MSDTAKKKSLVRPTVDTMFKIDFELWASRDPAWKSSLLSLLSTEDKEKYSDYINEDKLVDVIDPKSGKVTLVNALQSIIYNEIATGDLFINPRIAITEGLFRLFMKNGNKPLSPNNMSEMLNKDAKIILRTLLGVRPPKGIRPI